MALTRTSSGSDSPDRGEELRASLERATRAREEHGPWTDDQFRTAREADLSERTKPIRAVVLGSLLCLVLAALLTSGKLVEIAEREELGTWRDRHLTVAEGVDRVANFLSLNRPYDLILEVRGVGENAGERIDTIGAVEVQFADGDADDPTGADGAASPDAGDPVTSADPEAPEESAPPPTTTAPAEVTLPLRAATAEDPVVVHVAGDSQAEYLGQAIATEGGDRAVVVDVDARLATSLARPDYFNWPAELAATAADRDPDAVVLFIGSNGYQDMAGDDGSRIGIGTPEWESEWSRRLAVTLDLLAADHRHVFWVTQPPMRDSQRDDGATVMNRLARPVIDARPHVTEIDIWDDFGGDTYVDYATRGDDEIRARADDGVHLTRSASSWVAADVFAAMDEVWTFG